MFSKLLLFILVFSWINSAQAYFIFEPVVGYQQGSMEQTFSTPSKESFKLSGSQGGLRVHWLLPRSSVLIGLEGTYASGKIKSESGATADASYTLTDSSAHLGIYMNRLRFWAGYGLSLQLNTKNNGSDGKDKVYGGQLIKAGIGYLFFQNFSVNIEHSMQDFKTKLEAGSSTKIGAGNSFEVFKASETALTVSFPF